MIKLENYTKNINGETYVPFSIAEKAVKEALESSEEYKQTLNKLEDLNSQLDDAMKEIGEGFKEMKNIKL